MITRNLFLYWVGNEYKLIQILRNLIYLHSTNGNGYKVHLITDKNINEYIKNIPAYFSKLCPAHQADFVRVHVICDYGGIWLDSDTLVLDSLDSLFDILENKNGFFIKQNNDTLCNGIFGSKKQTPLMIEWKTQLINLLNIQKQHIKWTDIGNAMLQNMHKSNSTLFDSYKIFNGLDNLYPINYNKCVSEFIDKPYENYKTIVREYQPLIVLVNSVYNNLEPMSEQEILNGNMPLNYFINKSFENNRKLIYLKISKNMGTSMTELLKNKKSYCESYFIEDWNNDNFYKSNVITLAHKSNISKFKKTYAKIFEYANKIIIFRNPLDRLISGYNYLKLNKGYNFHLNNINRTIVKDEKHNYDKNYIHFDTLQLDAIDYDKKVYHTKLCYWISMNNQKQLCTILNNLGIKHEYNILPHKNKTSHSNMLDIPDDIKMFELLFKDDIKMFKMIN